jgi:hypothetical protein
MFSFAIHLVDGRLNGCLLEGCGLNGCGLGNGLMSAGGDLASTCIRYVTPAKVKSLRARITIMSSFFNKALKRADA